MTETAQLPGTSLILSEAQATGKLKLALTEAQIFIEKLSTAAVEIEVIEDNLENVKDLLNKITRARTAIDEAHARVKKPYLESGRACDTAKKDLLKIVQDIEDPLRKRYNGVCQVVEDRKNKAIAEEKRKKDILDGIEANVLAFSQQVAACETLNELSDVERKINIQKTPNVKAKYQEFHGQAITRFDEVLIPIIKSQKEKIKELDRLKAQKKSAEENADVDKVDELAVQIENAEHAIGFNKAAVQEQALSSLPTVAEAVVVHPVVPKGGRTDYAVEIIDLEQALKKSRSLLSIDLNISEAKNNARLLDAAKSFEGKSEIIVNGIKYTKKKTY